MTAQVDIIVLSCNTREDLLRCLSTLGEHPPASLGRLVVVDNGSRDGSLEAVRARWPAVGVIPLDENAGFARANNIGIRQCTAPLVLLLNSDTEVPPGAIDHLVDRLEATRATAAGPKLVDAAGTPEVSFGSMLSPAGELVQWLRGRLARSRGLFGRAYVARLVGRERDVGWVSGACLLVRREAAMAAGLLDERYFMYEEDVDFCAALRAAGGRILFTPAAQVVHLRGRSVAAAGRAATAHYDRSHLLFYEKHWPRWTPALRLWLRVRGRGIR